MCSSDLAGKSTILHSIYGFTNIFSGNITVDGKEVTNVTPAEKLKSFGIAYILQDNSVFPDMTVEEYLSNENASVISFTRLKVGEDIVIESKDFAEEVAEQLK